jgi:hypothetical protein
MLTQDEEVQRIFELMDQLDRLAWTHEPDLGKDSDWVPVSPEGRAVFARLTAPENRAGLRKWYARFGGVQLNPCAANVKASLERAMKEEQI